MEVDNSYKFVVKSERVYDDTGYVTMEHEVRYECGNNYFMPAGSPETVSCVNGSFVPENDKVQCLLGDFIYNGLNFFFQTKYYFLA